MTLSLKNFRKKIEEATQGIPKKHPENIASLLKANPYRVKITLKNLNKVSIHQINAFYLNCAKIDFLIKSGRLNQDLIFDYLIY